MLVSQVLVDELTVDADGESAVAQSALYTFGEERWVSAQRHVQGAALGPVTLLTPSSRSIDTPTVGLTHFEPFQVPWEGGRHQLTYTTTWTVRAHTIYALALPPEFVAKEARVHRHRSTGPGLTLAVSAESRLFYYGVFMEDDAIEIFATVERDSEESWRLVRDPTVRAGRRSYVALRRGVTADAVRPEFWLRIIDLGGRIFGS